MDNLPSSRRQVSALAASALLTATGGAVDAWVYLAHGHVFATAQTGNVVLMAIALAAGDGRAAGRHLPSLLAFVAGLILSRGSAIALKRQGLNSRDVRLGVEVALLVALGLGADRLTDPALTASVGFVAGLQITSLSHIGAWSFNTGMTTGNLRAAASAWVRVAAGSAEERPHALVLTALCAAFLAGALAGAWLTPRLGRWTPMLPAALVASAIAIGPRGLDPIPDWGSLRDDA